MTQRLDYQPRHSSSTKKNTNHLKKLYKCKTGDSVPILYVKYLKRRVKRVLIA